MQSQGVDCGQYFIPPFIIPHLTRFELRNPVKDTYFDKSDKTTNKPFLSVLYNKSNLNGLWLNIDFFAAITPLFGESLVYDTKSSLQCKL